MIRQFVSRSSMFRFIDQTYAFPIEFYRSEKVQSSPILLQYFSVIITINIFNHILLQILNLMFFCNHLSYRKAMLYNTFILNMI